MAALDLVRLANDTDELREQVRASFASSWPADCVGHRADAAAHADTDAADVVLGAPRRVRPIPAWRLRLVAIASQLVLLLVVGAWVMSTDEVTALAAKLLRVHPLAHVDTRQRGGRRGRARARRATSPLVAAELAARGIHVSFADGGRVPPQRTDRGAALARATNCCPKCRARRRCAGCARARRCAPRRARSGLRHRFYYLQPRGGLSVGQLVLARTAGATPISGALRLSATGPLPQRPARAGDVVVVAARRLASLGARRWSGSSPGWPRTGCASSRSQKLMRSPSISASSSGERASIAAPRDQQRQRERRAGTPPSGVSLKLSPNSSGASATGTIV